MRIPSLLIIVATLAATSTPAAASTLVLYDMDATIGRRLAASPYAGQEIARMEKQGLTRAVIMPVDDAGEEITRDIRMVAPLIVPPLGGVRTLTGSVVWRVTTQLVNGQLRYRNVITSEQGFTNGQGPLTDYRRSDVTLEGAVQMSSAMAPPIVRPYANNRGQRVMIGFLRP